MKRKIRLSFGCWVLLIVYSIIPLFMILGYLIF